MANKLYEESSISSIASAIRSKNGLTTTYKVSEMANAILNIPTGGVTPTGTKEITANGTYDVTNYASASVNVSSGGGLPSTMFAGEFVGNGTKNQTVTIEQTFPSAPKCIIAMPDSAIDATQYPLGDQVMAATYYWYDGVINQIMRKGSNATTITYSSTACTVDVSANGFTLKCANTNTYFPAVNWHWIAWV